MNKYSKIANKVENAVLASGRYMLDFMRKESDISVSYKSDRSPVTEVDLESEKIISAMLGADLPIVAEETPDSHKLVETESEYFLVDPLDGTRSCKRFIFSSVSEVGYGPLVGYVVGGRLAVSSYFNVPQATLFTAIKGQGTRRVVINSNSDVASFEDRERLYIDSPKALSDSAILFYFGKQGESEYVMKLLHDNKRHVDTAYRFGGFANDVSRLVQDYEQVQIQSAVKPWDYSAVLFSIESGLSVVCDPFGKRIPYDDWDIKLNNPVLTAHDSVMGDLIDSLP